MENGQAQMLEASKEKQPHVIVPVDNNNDEKTDTVIGHSPSSGKSAGSSASSSWVLSWEDLSYSVAIKKENKSKVLIGGMSGSIKSGEVVAIMGGSGAGKSTLLNCLAGRIGPGNLGGKILLNGKEREAGTWTKLCAYVEQDDVMFTNISVYDTLSYSALLRLPASLQRSEKLKRVNDIIMQLGLDNCRNTWIGDSMNRGISGGERKRVSIGIEMVTNPQVFFLDEPTSGLDAFNAFNIIQTIKQVAKAQGKVVLMTIHQPRTDILEMFDKIILLSAGKEVFSGTLDNAITHFDKLGYTLPPKTNPSDYFLDISTMDQRTPELREASTARIQKFHDAWAEEKRLAAASGNKDAVGSGETSAFSIKWPNSWFMEVSVLLSRNLKDVARDKGTIGATIGQGIMLMILNGFIFFRMPLDYAGAMDRFGLFFFICVNQTFGVVMPTLAIFPEQRRIIKRERSAGSYRSSSAYIAKAISTIPLTLAGALLLAVPIYWMAGLQADVGKYFTFIAIVVVQSLSANSLGIMIGSAVPNVKVGQIVGPLLIVFMLLFGGQFLNLDAVTWVFRWIQYLSIIAYSNKALAQNEMNGLTFNVCTSASTYPGCDKTSGASLLDKQGLNNIWLWYCVLINCSIMTLFTLIGALAFSRTTRPLLKLK